MSAEFADTNIVLYLLDNGPKADRAEAILGQGPRISVQVLNEAAVNCRRKAGLGWEDTAAFLAGIRALCPVEDLTLQTHEVGRALAERYNFAIYDAMIVASALIAGCTTLWTEDMHDGLLVEGQLRLANPFSRRA
ncbi:MAG: PIN domain-containing protein [Allgaiera sp.]|jgi:predicted nucleic acid-binding protein|nr:PIN domain-containing protein [Allgaiera sp.]